MHHFILFIKVGYNASKYEHMKTHSEDNQYLYSNCEFPSAQAEDCKIPNPSQTTYTLFKTSTTCSEIHRSNLIYK
jgi:hypothetical protein